MPLRPIVLAICLIALSLTAPALSADYEVRELAKFHDTPEGLAIDDAGNIYASLTHTGEIMKVTPEGETARIAVVPTEEDAAKGQTLGIALDEAGNIYAAFAERSPRYDGTNAVDPHHPACRDATVTLSGVYKIDAETRAVSPLATRADGYAFCVPDDVDVDSKGNVYMTDLTYSGIWKISPDGETVEMWSDDPLLNPSRRPSSGIFLGVNVLVLDAAEENIYAGTNGDSMVVRLPIRPDGSAGPAARVSAGHTPIDGIALDDRGRIYISEIARNEIWALAPGAGPYWDRRLVASKATAPLDNNASLVWADGAVCTANLGASHGDNIEEAERTIVCIRGYDTP